MILTRDGRTDRPSDGWTDGQTLLISFNSLVLKVGLAISLSDGLSVGLSVYRSVCRSVVWLVGRSVSLSVHLKFFCIFKHIQ